MSFGRCITPRRMAGMAAALLLAAVTAGGAAKAQEEGLVTDLSTAMIELKTSFAGRDLILFGAIDRHKATTAGVRYDLVLVIEGPPVATLVRRKDRVSGIWINNARAIFQEAPGYYALASSRPLDQIVDAAALAELKLGLDNLQLRPDRAGADGEEAAAFRAGLIRNRQQQGLYQESAGSVRLMENTLFRAGFRLPSTVPEGKYLARAYLFRDGQLLGQRETDLQVSKAGFARTVFSLANERPAVYGLLAVLLALLAGWLAGFVSGRKGH